MATGVPSSVVTSPAADSLANLQRYVLDYTQTPSQPTPLDNARREINRAIEEVNTLNWRQIISSQQFSMGLDQAEYDLNTEVKEPFHCELLDSSFNPKARLQYKEWKTFLIEHADAEVSGDSRYYSLDYARRKLVLQRACNQGFIDSYAYARLHYHRRLAAMYESADRHGAPSEFNSFIGWKARAGWAASRGAMDAASVALAQARGIWRDLIHNNTDSMTDWSEW